MGGFSIDASGFHWISGAPDDPEDLCLHGHAEAEIGGELLEYDCTVSAAALYLLKSLTEDHIMGSGEQMLPCCGFFLVADEAGENVEIIGCDHGEDWTVLHDGDNVRLITPSGCETVVPIGEYRGEVFRFADKVADFYRSCSPKREPGDEFDRRGWAAFRREWHRRRWQT